MAKLLIPDPSEPFQREGKVSEFWYKFLDRLTGQLNSTVSGISGALGTVADVWSAATGKTVTTNLLEDAAAFVPLTDAGPVAVDWATFINGSLTITANRQIGNPTNAQPGTYRSILVQGNNSTDRTITFAANYQGDLPTITDCDSGKWYLITVMCITTTHFIASARVAKS